MTTRAKDWSNVSEDDVKMWASLKLFILRDQESKEREKKVFQELQKKLYWILPPKSFILYNFYPWFLFHYITFF